MTDVPPQNLDAERATIGAMLTNNSVIPDVMALITPADYHDGHCGRMHREIVVIHQRGEPVDVVTLAHRLSIDTQTLGHRLGLDTVDVVGYLAAVPHASHAAHYAGIVREMAERRRAIDECKMRMAEALDTTTPFAANGQSQSNKEPPPQYQAFPVGALPEPMRGFIIAGSKAIGCDAAYIALPLLSVMGAAVGNSRRLRVKRTWHAPPIIWTAIIGESGTAKSPAHKLALGAVRDGQRKAFEEYAIAQADYDAALLHHEKRIAAWKRDKKTMESPPTPPEPPTPTRYVVSDATVEGLAPILRDNPRGVLLERDELAGWIGSFDKYSSGKGGDSAHWLSMYDGESITVDRKTGAERVIHVPLAAVCITGGIQPGILRRALGAEHRESGLLARLLLAAPPRMPKRWTEAELHQSVEDAIASVIGRLLSLEMVPDANGNPRPALVGLAPDAKTAFRDYYNGINAEMVGHDGERAAALAKLEGYAPRLALVVHLVRWAADDPTLSDADTLDAESMRAGITLADWFRAEALRVYGILSESETDRDQRRLVDWIQSRGGSVTAREVAKGCRWIKTSGDAESALRNLVKAGIGTWEASPRGQGGRPTRRFALRTVGVVGVGETLPIPKINGGFADADNADRLKTEHDPDDDWGERYFTDREER